MNKVTHAIEAHRTARAIIDSQPNDDAVDIELNAIQTVIKAPCGSDEDFFGKVAYIAGCATRYDEGYAESLVDAVNAYLVERAAARPAGPSAA